MTAAALSRPTFSRLAYGGVLAVLGTATVAMVAQHGLLGIAIAAVIAPDLALVLGAGRGLVKGQLHPRAVPVYNAVHRFYGPAVLMAVGLIASPAALVAGLAWGVHVAL